MSAPTIYGFFTLANGDHVMTTKSNSSVRSYHAHYSTSIACSSAGRDPGKLARLHPLSPPDTSTAQELAHFVYPDHVLSQLNLCLRHGVLAPTNVQADEYNRYMLTRLTGTERVYLAADTLKEADDVELQVNADGVLDYVAAHSPPGFPHHRLIVKTNSVFRLLPKLSIGRGLVKNAHVVVRHVGSRLITVSILRGMGGVSNIDEEQILIPRISFTSTVAKV